MLSMIQLKGFWLQKTERNKEETTVTTNGTSSPTDSLLNESHANPMKPNRETVRTSLQRLEAGLQRARAAIKEASISGYHPLEDPDYVPIGPIYRDAKAFHRYAYPTPIIVFQYLHSSSLLWQILVYFLLQYKNENVHIYLYIHVSTINCLFQDSE